MLCELHYNARGRRGRDRMVVGFKTTYAISVYHHWCCEIESQSVWGVQHYVIKFVSDLDRSVVFSGYSCFLHQENWPPLYNWNIVESGVKLHKTKPNQTILMPHIICHKNNLLIPQKWSLMSYIWSYAMIDWFLVF